MSNQPQILDLDKVISTKRIVKLAGKEIDVSKIPSRVTMELVEKSEELKAGGKQSFPLLLDMIVKVCRPSQPEITSDWLIDNTDFEQLMAIIEFVMAPVKARAEGNVKNEESPNQ
ncbi:hypothetical protein [Cohnella herbarum]|uniref:Phage tail assembly protein n=1 Tax=Cohnella herbarum TaxID=2728023 RepID=A0A7Z2VRV8_9BACL|nr:hypothetical protein [Cohnella herbarum]QJD87902.1 hypothetical protein HH215_35070 [Cohnella herbarum]